MCKHEVKMVNIMPACNSAAREVDTEQVSYKPLTGRSEIKEKGWSWLWALEPPHLSSY